MSTRASALIFAGSALATSATLGIAACSSGTLPVDFTLLRDGAIIPGFDAATLDTGNASADTSLPLKDAARDSTSNADTSPPPMDAGTGSDSSSVACANPPKLFVPTNAGIYCPFGGGSTYCSALSPVCCLSPANDAGPSVCEPNAGACANTFKPWACSAPQECTGSGEVCCLTAGPLEADPNCSGYQKTQGFDNTRCVLPAACAGPVSIDAGQYIDDQFVVCEQQSDCALGTCTPVRTTGTPIGLCL